MNERNFSSAIFMRSSALLRISRDLRVGTVRSSLVYASSVWRIRSLITLFFAKTPQELNVRRVTCYTTSLYDIHFKCALNFGDAQVVHLPVFLVFLQPVIGEDADASAENTKNPPTGLSAEAVRVDRVLDDPLWQSAKPITDFRQRESQEGEPATEKTGVRIPYTRRAVYFGIHCFDSEPSRIIATELRRDVSQDLDDHSRSSSIPTMIVAVAISSKSTRWEHKTMDWLKSEVHRRIRISIPGGAMSGLRSHASPRMVGPRRSKSPSPR
jgi:hypothetical protein